MSELLQIGDLRFEVLSDGSRTPDGFGWSVDIESSRKVDEKVGEKEDDATLTDKGREVRKVTIKITWNDGFESSSAAADIVAALDPSNPKPGDPPAFAYVRNGLNLGKLKNVKAIKVKSAKGPNVADTGVVTYELTCSSWAKPKPSAGAGTPKDAKKFVLGSETTQTVKNFGGNGNTVQFPPNRSPAPGVPKP